MRQVLAALVFALAACNSAPQGDPKLPPEFNRVVARYNGEPVTWIEIAGRMMDLNPQEALDKYVYWRVVEDHKKELGIRNTEEELLERAKTAIRQVKASKGEDKFAADLLAGKMTEEEYAKELSKSPNLAEVLALEKLACYHLMQVGALEADWGMFTNKEDAGVFLEYLKINQKFDEAWEKVNKTRLEGKLHKTQTGIFTMGMRPKHLDEYIADHLFTLKKGEESKVEHSFSSSMYYVFRITDKIEKTQAPYSEVRQEVLKRVLQHPPPQDLLRRWIEGRVRSVEADLIQKP